MKKMTLQAQEDTKMENLSQFGYVELMKFVPKPNSGTEEI
jgi:hypothetical protein